MFGNEYSNNFYIWLVLLILIFFTDGSKSPISQGNYFKLTSPSQILNGLISYIKEGKDMIDERCGCGCGCGNNNCGGGCGGGCGGFGGGCCLWIVLIIIVLFCCCGCGC